MKKNVVSAINRGKMLYIIDGSLLGLIAGVAIYLLANKILSDRLARAVWFTVAIAIYVIASHVAKLNQLPEITSGVKMAGIVMMLVMFGVGFFLTEIVFKKFIKPRS